MFDNIDHLFDLPDGHFYAVMDCFCEPNWQNSPQYKIGYCQQSPNKVEWPKHQLGPKPPLYFNAGMFIFEPKNVDLERVKVVHYYTDGSKPWRYTGKEKNMDRDDIKMLVKKWWNIFNDETLDYWRICEHSIGTPLTAVEKPTPVLTKSGRRYITATSAA
ncbi:hypothetical protein M8C21_019996 [Ambrosia artemisiifolia]|uniref:Hexosyltransferase n=1 Tax=Ambrosia artemisiifolia TaxID=4212 RepID=A0AAD5G5X1_AMBAR|nr:hypothetical protein M8C21_019996 [Ambrosia artemisiifolia]